MLALGLGEAAEQGHQIIAGIIEGVDVLFFKDDSDVSGLQHPHNLQAVHHIPGEAEQGLGEDQVDLSPLAGGDHAVELPPIFHGGSTQALVGEDARQFPIRVLLDLLSVVGFLRSAAIEGTLVTCCHPAVGGYPQLSFQSDFFHEVHSSACYLKWTVTS